MVPPEKTKRQNEEEGAKKEMNPRREELWPGLLSGSTLPVLLRYFLVLPGTSMNCEVLLGTLRYF